jgi:hypothetical protein
LGKGRFFPAFSSSQQQKIFTASWRYTGMSWFNGKKTYILSAFMIVVSLIHLLAGNLTLIEFIGSDHMINLFEALGLSTLRIGISQNQKETTHEIV